MIWYKFIPDTIVIRLGNNAWYKLYITSVSDCFHELFLNVKLFQKKQQVTLCFQKNHQVILTTGNTYFQDHNLALADIASLS